MAPAGEVTEDYFDPPPLRVDEFDHWNLGTYSSALQAGILPAIGFHRAVGPELIHARVWEHRQVHRVHMKYRRAGAAEGFRMSPHIHTLKSELDRFVQALEVVVQ